MAQQPITIEIAMALAKQSADKGDVAPARNLYKKILESDPGYKPARKALKNLRRGKTTTQVPAKIFQQDMAALMTLRSSGNLDDALKEAVRLSRKYPTQPMPLNVQGSILYAKHLYTEAAAILSKAHEMAPDKAIASFERSIELDPKAGHASHFLAIAKGTTTPTAPAGYVKGGFDDYAGKFESSLVQGLSYDGPTTLHKLLGEVSEGTDLRILDLGCGTGLAGLAFENVACEMIGVDLSPKMLKEAEKKNIYSELACEDAVVWLKGQSRHFDLFIAADMLIYIGRLESLFAAVRSHSSDNARFAISTELLADDRGDMELRTSGRYAHSNSYVERAAAEQGFEIEAYTTAPLRKEHKEWLEGGFYILKAAAYR